MEWISVKDRLPDKDMDVVYLGEVWRYGVKTYDSSGVCHFYKETAGGWFDTTPQDGDHQSTEVTHWMPLPPPPTDGEEET